MDGDVAEQGLPVLVGAPVLPADGNPGVLYLASLAPGPSRTSMRSALGVLAGLLGVADFAACPWHRLRYAHVAALRGVLRDRFAPATANRYLSALRRVCREAWLLGLLPVEEYQRICTVPAVVGHREPRGRVLSGHELRLLFFACRDGTPAGARDACAFALLYGAGLRRAEAVAVDVADFRPAGALLVRGKRASERLVYPSPGVDAALAAWRAVRGPAPGSLLCPVRKDGHVLAGVRWSAHALRVRLHRRAGEAGIDPCTPHDLRRSYVTDALAAGVDSATVSRLVGHASPSTTMLYDRRGEREKALGAQKVRVPFFAG